MTAVHRTFIVLEGSPCEESALVFERPVATTRRLPGVCSAFAAPCGGGAELGRALAAPLSTASSKASKEMHTHKASYDITLKMRNREHQNRQGHMHINFSTSTIRSDFTDINRDRIKHMYYCKALKTGPITGRGNTNRKPIYCP